MKRFRHAWAMCIAIVGCGCAHLPPSDRVETTFTIPVSIEEARKVCPSAIVSFLGHDSRDKPVLNKTGDEDVVSCSVVAGGLKRYHWNIVLQLDSKYETSMTITRFIVEQGSYVPAASGREEQGFVTYFIRALAKKGNG